MMGIQDRPLGGGTERPRILPTCSSSRIAAALCLLMMALIPHVRSESTGNSCIFLYQTTSNRAELSTLDHHHINKEELPLCPTAQDDETPWPLTTGCRQTCDSPVFGCIGLSFVDTADHSVLYMGCSSYPNGLGMNANNNPTVALLQDNSPYEGLGASMSNCAQFEQWWLDHTNGAVRNSVCGECHDENNCIPSQMLPQETTASTSMTARTTAEERETAKDNYHSMHQHPSLRMVRNEQEVPSDNEEQVANGNSAMVLIIVVIVIAALFFNLCMGFGLWYYINKEPSPTTTSTSSTEAPANGSGEQPLSKQKDKKSRNKADKNKKDPSLPLTKTSQETVSRGPRDDDDEEIVSAASNRNSFRPDATEDLERQDQEALAAAIKASLQDAPPSTPQPQPITPKGLLVAPGASASWAGAMGASLMSHPTSLQSGGTIPSEVLLFEQGQRSSNNTIGRTCPIQHLDSHLRIGSGSASVGGGGSVGGHSFSALTVATAPAHPGAVMAKDRWASMSTDQASKPQVSLPFWRQEQDPSSSAASVGGGSTSSVPFWRQAAVDKSKLLMVNGKAVPPAPPSTSPSTTYKASSSVSSWMVREVAEGE